ncbi:MAG: hypothetical protein MZV70_43185 [Desulfobacterales bacterium]|nr:hypothetical protein [Desulfobacterales bacterium]
MLGVMQPHLLADRRLQLLDDRGVARAELPDLWRHAAHDVHRELALVGLADPAALRELLQHAGTLAVGVAPPQQEQRVAARSAPARRTRCHQKYDLKLRRGGRAAGDAGRFEEPLEVGRPVADMQDRSGVAMRGSYPSPWVCSAQSCDSIGTSLQQRHGEPPPGAGVRLALEPPILAIHPVVPDQTLAFLQHHAVAQLGPGRALELRAQLLGEFRALDQHAHLGVEVGRAGIEVHRAYEDPAAGR